MPLYWGSITISCLLSCFLLATMSYLIEFFPVPSDVFHYFETCIAPFSKKERQFARQVLASNILQLNKVRRENLEGWVGLEVELPSQTIDELFTTRFSWKALDGKVLTVSGYSQVRHECHRFVVKAEILDHILGLLAPTTEQASKQQLVNLIDGAPFVRPIPRARDFGIHTPPLVRDSIRAIAPCPFNGAALDAHVARRKAEAEHPKLSGKARETAERRYKNDDMCKMRITAGCRKRDDGFFEYEPYYRPHLSGRIAEVGGGLQSCSRAMKHAALSTVPNLRNYDIKASQAYVLLQELQDAGIGTTWLDKYLALADGAAHYASLIGIDKRTFKDCLYATIMGTPFNASHFDPDENAIFGALLKEFGDHSKAAQFMVRVHAKLTPLRDLVVEWHEWLIDSDSCLHAEGKVGKRQLRNAVGNVLKLAEQPPHKRKKRAAAHILQGWEARYIHELTVLSKPHGFTPVSNQHDGLVTIGEIPTQAQDAAKTASGFRYARLEEKSFV